ncbi:MAG: 6-bladed beta-propeller [Chlorobi bacterium]|nr:6-bladed beta-propeller [Chlorobiota bacterium]
MLKSPKPDNLIIFPPPPDTTRIQFLTFINTSQDISGKQSRFSKFMFGEQKPKPIVRPYGIQTWKNRLYICDTGIGGIELIDFSEGSFDYFQPGGKGQLKLPLNCFVDDAGKLFVADGNRKQIVVFDEEGKYLDAFGETENFKPTDVAIYKDKIFVANILGHQICVYDTIEHKLLYTIPEQQPDKNNRLYQPTNITVTNDMIYVSDFGDFTIKVYSINGKFITSVGGYGRSPGQFTRPKGIETDRKGNLFVVDAAFENVQIFDSHGSLLMFFGGTGNMNLPAGISISYDDLSYFNDLVDESYTLKYLIFVTNQFGSNKIGVYGFVEPRE